MRLTKKWNRYLPSFDRCTIYNVINKYGTAAEERINKMEKKEQLYEGKAKKVFATDDPDLTLSYPTRMMQQHSTASRKALSQVRALSTTK